MAFKAGNNATIYLTSTSTAMTSEAMSLSASNVYQISTSSKRVIDPDVSITFYDNGIPLSSSNIVSVDYLFGKLTITGSYTPTGSITCTGYYLPLVQVGNATSVQYSISSNNQDSTVFGDTSRKRTSTMLDAEGTLTYFDFSGLTTIGSASVYTRMVEGTTFIIEVNEDSSADYVMRARAIFESLDSSYNVEDLISTNVKWYLNSKVGTSNSTVAISLGYK